MSNPSVTYTFVNGNVADAGQVNTNFQNIIDGVTDGTKSLNIDALTCAGTLTANGNTTIGNAASDTCDINATTSFNLGLSPNGKAGSDADVTMSINSNKFTVVTCSAARVYKLPTTSVKTGDTYTFINRATNDSYRLNLQASSDTGTTYVDWIVNGKITVMALQDTPTAAAHWATVDAASDWTSYSCTVTTGTWTAVRAYYRRTNSNMEARIYSGPITDSGSGLYIWNLPTGVSANFTALGASGVTPSITEGNATSNTIVVVGSCSMNNQGQPWAFAGTTFGTGAHVSLVTSSGNTVCVIADSLTNDSRFNAIGSFINIAAVSGVFQLSFSMPVTEWAMFN